MLNTERREFLKTVLGFGLTGYACRPSADFSCPLPISTQQKDHQSEASGAQSGFQSPAIIKPPALRRGDLIALVSPGAAISLRHRLATLDVAVAALEREGFRVKVMPHARGRAADGKAGSLQERAADLNAAFADPDVRMVMGTVGGGGTGELVAGDILDWNALRNHPKLLCGYSDLASLNVPAYLRLGLITLDGPLAVFYWGCLPAPPSYTIQSFRRIAMHVKPAGSQRPPQKYSVSPFEFTGADDLAKRLRPASAWRCLRPGRAAGRLLALSAPQVLDLQTAGYDTSLAGHIWCLDTPDVGEEFSRWMRRIRAEGLLDGVKGIVTTRMIGYPGSTPAPPDQRDAAILETTDGLDIPILADVDCGHTIPRLTIPNGILATLDSEHRLFRIEESAVAKAKE